jgi:lysyl-tRNA synthetase class 1
VDWPARWAYYDEDFEPCGKDHAAAGGSWVTSKEIIKDVWEMEGPSKQFYEWIGIKGGKQFKKSKGIATTISEVLEVYEPEIVRYLFAGTRPNAVFSISFDLDVVKIYEDFDACERIYYGKEELTNKKEILKQKRIYELSCTGEIPKKMPEQVGFRHLTTLLQIHEGDLDKATEGMSERVKKRAACAWNWLQKYAPEDFKFKVNSEINSEIKAKLTGKQKKALKILCKKLEGKYDSDSLFNEFYNICQEAGIKNIDFFKGAYLVLISKERGPRLSNFILTLGKSRVRELLEQV